MGDRRWTNNAEEEICMGYYSKGGAGNTVRNVL
jgi:hypothetical protein